MRYLFFAAVAIVNLIFTGSIFPNLSIAGIYPDIIMCTIVSIALLEKSMAGAFLGLACGLTLDLFFSGTIGLYALPYFVVGAIIYFVSNSLRYIDKFLFPAIFAVCAYLLKAFISSLLAYMLGVQFTFSYMFIRFILPQALATGLLMLLIHFLFARFYRSSSMKIKSNDEFKHL